MAHKVTIECEARFVDHVSGESQNASDSLNDIGTAAEKAQKKVNNLGKKKAKPIFDADNNRLLKKIREAEARAEKLGKTKATVVLQALDKASSAIGKVLNKAQNFGGRVWSGILKIKNSQAMEAIGNVTSAAKTIAGKTWEAIVKVKDYALTPLNKIKNALFNIKTLAAAVFAGVATKQLIMNPINLADAYSSAKIGFTTLLGEQGGEDMMDDIDAFAKATPFKTSGVISNVQKMMAYGWDADRIIKDMETIGDAAAATGKGDEGLSSIVYALSEIRSKGKLSTQELNQLASAGIKAKQYLAEGLGYGSDDAGLMKLSEDLEAGAIGANQAIDLILQGMEEFDGMMDKTANETVTGLWSQIEDTFEINVFRKWGQGLQDGAKRGFGSIVSLLNDSEDALSSLGDTLYNVGKAMSNWAADKLERAVKTIKEVTQTADFQNASLGGKIKILWNEVIADPFSEWWNSEGKAKIAGFAGDVGKTIGAGITGGLLALLGFNAEDALVDGISIGGSFMDGFLEGFDTDRIGEALKEWVSNNKGLATILGGVLAWKLISGIAGGLSSLKNLFGSKSGGGGLGGLASSYTTATMDVTAGVVNVYGNSGFNTGNYGGGGASGTGGGNVLLPSTGVGKKLLTGGGNSTVKGLLTSGSGTAAKTLTGVTLKNGTVAATGSTLTAGLAKTGVALGSGATTVGGAAAVGGASILGSIAAALGLADAGVDVYQGVKAGKSGDKKKAKDEYVTAGTKAGMVGTGAAIGAGIGALFGGVGAGPGALIGAGIGGIAALFTGDKAGKALSDGSDEGGWLSNAWDSTKQFFSETIPEKWNEFWDGTQSFFSETIPTAWGKLKSKTSTFFSETLPTAWNGFWDSVGGFFTEDVPYAIGYACGKIGIFFTETLPNAWNSFWDAVGTFFTETIPNAWNACCNAVGTFFTEILPNAWNSFWGAISTFFTETLPAWADTVWNGHIVPFFTETLPDAWDSFWNAIGTFFTETLPAWVGNIWSGHIAPFFTETVPSFFVSLFAGIGNFFTDTLPTFISNACGAIGTFFTDTIPGWINDVIGGVKDWASEQISKVKSWFGAGADDAKSGAGYGASQGKKARGGIIGGDSSMDAYARGGRTDGGIIGGSTRWIRVNEESPEMIIPLSSQRRERAMKLWAKTGQLLGVPGFARGGITTDDNDEGLRFHGIDTESTGGRSVVVEVGGINIEIKVDGTDKGSIIRAIKEQLTDIAEEVAGIFADEFEALFENTPVRGEVN